MSALEQLARKAWLGWGNYAKYTRCSGCGSFEYCRARRYAGPWLCLTCHDLKG